MKIRRLTLIIGICAALNTLTFTYAAKVTIQSPQTVSSNGTPLSLSVMVDAEGDRVSGVSGTFSFNASLFDIQTISTNGSVVSLWAESPHITEESNFNGRTSVHFEGIIPGGFTGVRNGYTVSSLPGVLFTITLIPKQRGRDIFLVDNVLLYAYDEGATLLSTKGDSIPMFVPQLTMVHNKTPQEEGKLDTTSVQVTFSESELIDNGATYLYVYDTDQSRTIDHIEIAESRKYDSRDLASYEWRGVSNPYVLQNQSRQKFIHIKIFYTNNTYTIKTIPPVENSSNLVALSRILIGILVVILLLLLYGKNVQYFFSKNISK